MNNHLIEKYVLTTGIDLTTMFDVAEEVLGNRIFGFYCDQSNRDIVVFLNAVTMMLFILNHEDHNDFIEKDSQNYQVTIKSDSFLSIKLSSLQSRLNFKAEVVSNFRVSLPTLEDFQAFHACLNNIPDCQAVFLDE